MIARLLGAIQFLTILPVHRSTTSLGQSALFFPLVGAAIGASGALLLQGLGAVLPPALAAGIVLCFWAFLTGGLHEDGLADVADAFRAGRPPEKILAILKDSRIGAHGALALLLAVLLRWHSLGSLATAELAGSLAATLAVSRASMVALAWIAPPAGRGSGFEFSRSLTTPIAGGAILQAVALSLFSPGAVFLVWGASLIVLGARWYFVRRLGGVTGDGLGATCMIVETWGLLSLTCRLCT